jgi:hypothetical protein
MSAVAVDLSGGQTASVQTDVNGNYSFANLLSGRDYTVTATKAGVRFDPGRGVFNNLTSGQTLDFVVDTDATILGRVFRTQNGIAVSQAKVTIKDSNGATINTAYTNTFGYFNFNQIPVNQTYTISVTSRRDLFDPRSISVIDDVSGFDFIALP